MKNNAITILVDSVIWDCVGTTRCKVSPTPFLDSLKKESVTATRLYSHGPYTDAATRSLYTGRRCLDDFSYYFKLNTSPTHHYKVFHDNGYETYGLYYPYYMVGKEMRKSIDHTYYTAGFIFGSEWGGCFYYYADIIKTRRLNEQEVFLIKKRLEMMFDIWMQFYKDILDHPETITMIADVVCSFNVKEGLKILEEQKTLFEHNPIDYIYDFLTKGKSHILAHLDGIDVDVKVDRKFLDEKVYKYYKDFFSFASKINFRANWWKNRPSFSRVASCISKFLKTKNKNDIMLLANYLMCINSINIVKKQSHSHWQDLPSARTQLNFAETILKNRKDTDKPFYMSLHFLEPHNEVSFFTFDTQEREVLEEEFNMLFDYCRDLGSNFIGNLAYYLSIRYTDYCIEKFCKELKEIGLWDNTALTILSDHGSSYSFYPLHGTHVNCFDEECYHVPVLIRTPNGKGKEITDYHNSLDVMPTLYDLMGFKKPSNVIGESMLAGKPSKDFVMTEYMGPGCPDMLSRPIWFSIRDSHYSIGYKIGIYQEFEEGDLCEVYDLSNDPNGFHNRVNSIGRQELEYLLIHLKNRFEEVKKDSYEYINKLMKN